MKLVVDKESLVSVADAIREKGGTSESLTFPQGFVDGIGAIESGGGGTEEFVGIKLSNFVNGFATIADLRSIPLTNDMLNNQSFLFYMFYNNGLYSRLEYVYLPDGLTSFADCLFYQLSELKEIHGDFSNIKSVVQYAFSYCRNFTEFPNMPKLETIGAKAFRSCGFKEVKLSAAIVSISNNAFEGCNSLKDIYVPWAEGAVANAPWGATNATIHYNSGV